MPEERTADRLRAPSLGGQAKPTMAVRPTGLGMAFWIPWFLVNIAWAVIIGLWLESSREVPVALLVAAVAGTLQWVILRRAAGVSIWWVPATFVVGVAGSGLGAVVEYIINMSRYSRCSLWFGPCLPPNYTLEIVVLSFGLLTIGAILGFAQSLILEKRTYEAVPWMLAYVLSFIVGGLLAYASQLAHWYPPSLTFVPLGVAYAAATGIVLARMTFHSESST